MNYQRLNATAHDLLGAPTGLGDEETAIRARLQMPGRRRSGRSWGARDRLRATASIARIEGTTWPIRRSRRVSRGETSRDAASTFVVKPERALHETPLDCTDDGSPCVRADARFVGAAAHRYRKLEGLDRIT